MADEKTTNNDQIDTIERGEEEERKNAEEFGEPVEQ